MIAASIRKNASLFARKINGQQSDLLRSSETRENEHGQVGDEGEQEEDEELRSRRLKTSEEVQDDVENGSSSELERKIDESD